MTHSHLLFGIVSMLSLLLPFLTRPGWYMSTTTTHNSRYLHVSFLLRQVLGAQSIAFKRPAMQQFEVINSANFNLVHKKNYMKQTNSCLSFGTNSGRSCSLGMEIRRGKPWRTSQITFIGSHGPTSWLLSQQPCFGLAWGFILRCGILVLVLEVPLHDIFYCQCQVPSCKFTC
jgi:hypothetical protein